MDNIRNNIKLFLDKYLILFIAFFGLLTILPYTSFFKGLQISNTPGIIYRGILLGVICLAFILLIIVNKTKIHISIYVCTGLYFVSQLITIFVSPTIKNVDIPLLYTIMGLGQSTITSLSVLVYLSINKNLEFSKKTIDLLCLSMLCIGVLLCLYTYIFQYEDIYHTFNTEYGWNYDVTSIFTMKTEYGFILFICSIFSIFYILNNRRYWMYIFPIFFLINMFISRSKTSILCTSGILICLIIIHFFNSWKQFKRILVPMLIGIGLLILSLAIVTSLRIGWFEKFHYYITQVMLNDAYVVMADRLHKWGLLIKKIDNPFNIIFGFGERITPLILSNCGCAAIGDSIYLSNYGIGGLIKFSLYIALAIYIMFCTWRSGLNKKSKAIALIIQLFFLISGLFEDDSIVGVTMSGLFSSIIFYSCNKMIKVDL